MKKGKQVAVSYSYKEWRQVAIPFYKWKICYHHDNKRDSMR